MQKVFGVGGWKKMERRTDFELTIENVSLCEPAVPQGREVCGDSAQSESKVLERLIASAEAKTWSDARDTCEQGCEKKFQLSFNRNQTRCLIIFHLRFQQKTKKHGV